MRFSNSQLWPNKSTMKTTSCAWLEANLKSDLSINKKTKIISLGSCFAREIKFWLIENNFNYLLGEQGKSPWASSQVFRGDKKRPPTDHASIAWERVYNTFTFKHIVDYTFGDNRLDERLIDVKIKGKTYTSDIIRSRILYPNRDIAKKDILNHIDESRRMFESTDLVIFTLGLTEIWESKKRGLVAATNPLKHYPLPSDFEFRVSRYQENLNNLLHSYKVLRSHNKNLKFLITVSPIHLLATFRDDLDVMSASCNSKSTLRAVADEFKDVPGASYFPSYEMATMGSVLDDINPYSDNHHVSRDVVDKIMRAFCKNCVG